MSNIKLFENPFLGSVRIVMINGDPWFVAKDAAACLGYEDESAALVNCFVDEKRILAGEQFRERERLYVLDTIYIERPERLPALPELSNDPEGLAIISESGFYSLIMRSSKPEAESFKRRVLREIIPFIRKTGSYLPGTAVKAWIDIK